MRPENCGGGVCATKCTAMSKRANKISFRISIHQLVPSSSAFSEGGLKPVLCRRLEAGTVINEYCYSFTMNYSNA
jgi:hypothetical protein